MSIMAARTDRTLRTSGELVCAQALALAPGDSGLDAAGHARLVVLLEDLLAAIDSPTTARPQTWASLLAHRSAGARHLDELAADLARGTDPAELSSLAMTRTAMVQGVLSGPLPAGISNQFGNSHLVDHLRATLLELTVLATAAEPGVLLPACLRMAVRTLSQALGERFPGQTIEVRIPPASAVQVGAFGAGPTHTRGTPPNVVETDERTWLELGTGLLDLPAAIRQARVVASGSHHQALERMLPIIDLAHLA